ncbi:hypothetical protein OKW22_001434 [Bacilli bacterium PM5-3]|nr:hypothetical protein [Bacilli bacterium PM5-3]
MKKKLIILILFFLFITPYNINAKKIIKKTNYIDTITEYKKGYYEYYKKTEIKYRKNRVKKEKIVIYKNKDSQRKIGYIYVYNKKGQLKSTKFGNAYKKTYYYYNNDKISKRIVQKYNQKGKISNKNTKIYIKEYLKNKPVEYKKSNTLIFSHRGVPSECIQHTFESYDKAIDYGSKYLEIDLLMTNDNYLVVHHSGNLNETTNYDVSITKSNLEELKKYKYDNGEEIKTLREVFEKYGKRVNYVIVDCQHFNGQLL